jgi:hypothetical protein
VNLAAMFSAAGPATRTPGPIAGTVKDGPDADGMILVAWQADAAVDTDAADGYERVRWVSRDGYQPQVGDEAVMVLDSRGDAWAIVVPSAGVTSGAPANARLAGADPTGAADATAAIQSLLSTVNHVIVPAGTYRVDTPVIVGSGKTLELGSGTILKRFPAAGSTDPVVNVTGIDARLLGRGTIQSEKTSPKGLVLIGPLTQTVTTTVDQWRLGPLKLIGRAAPTSADIGLNVWSSQAAGGDGGSGAGANYNGIADPGLWISNVGEGLRLGSLCNAHTFGAINFSQIATYCYRLRGGADGVQECNFIGGFTHTSLGGTANITIVKGERAMFCQWIGVQGEPRDVAGTVPYDFDANSTYNRLFGYFNIPGAHAGVDSGTHNFVMDGLFLKVPKMVLSTGEVNIKIVSGAPTDGLFFSPLHNGTLAWDDTNRKLYIKDGAGVWRASGVFT